MTTQTTRKPKLLIVDDTPDSLSFLFSTLNKINYQVSMANSGAEAIQQAKIVQPGLILLDVMMPGMDGFETCRRLKADKTTTNIPVIFMTALNDINSKVQGFEAGGVDYVTKPIEWRELQARINTHLTIRHLRENLQAEIEHRQKVEASLNHYSTVIENQASQLRQAQENIQRLEEQLELQTNSTQTS